MTQTNSNRLTATNANGTSVRTLHVTGIAEQWPIPGGEASEDIFTKQDFEDALKKVSRHIGKSKPSPKSSKT